MSGSNDTKEDHGSQGPNPSPGRNGDHGGHSGHGAASALARLKSQKQERQQGGDPEDAAGGHGQ
jgi:hypothetical protein